MKEKLTKNLGVKLLSIPLAAIIWIVIINIDDPISTKVINNVQVEVLNESYITNSGQVYDIVEGNTISVTVRAKRSIRDKIRSSDLHVTADLANITQFNRVEIVAECTKYSSDSVELTPKPKMLTVSLEDIGTKTLPIQIATTGVVDSGYYIDSLKASPNMIEVKGAESTIEKIAEVKVFVDISGHQESFSQDGLKARVYDEKGGEIDSSRLTFSHNNIKVKVGILPTKTVPIKIETKGTPATGYMVSKVEYGPEQIALAGEADVLSKVYSVPITINVDGLSADKETDIELADYLPDNTKLVDDTKTIAVRITAGKTEEKDISLTEDSIQLQNLGETYLAKLSLPLPEVSIIAVGEESLAGITASDLGAYVDLDGLGPGTYNLELHFEEQSKFTIRESVMITIVISEEIINAPDSNNLPSAPPNGDSAQIEPTPSESPAN